MNPPSICLIFIALAFVHGVYSQKFPYIGECEYVHNDLLIQRTVSFICVENFVKTKFFPNRSVISLCQTTHFNTALVSDIKFQSCDLAQIPDNIFKSYSNLVRLNATNLGIETMQPKNFAGAKNLKYLFASGNKLTRVPANVFHETDNLERLYLDSNQITYFDPNAFALKNNLRILSLSYNNISALPMDTFGNLFRLQTLDLSHNNISELSPAMFQNLVEMQTLNISFNKITVLPAFLFHQTESLREVNLSSNQIKKIENYVFSGALNLKKLSLANNQLGTLSRRIFNFHSNFIDFIDVSFNEITELKVETMEVLNKLVNFNVSGNPIKILNSETFRHNVQLETLSFSQCGLSQIEPRTFSSQKKLEKLDLSYNQLKTLDPNTFPSPLPQKLEIAGIDTNQFNCAFLEKLVFYIEPWHFNSIQFFNKFMTKEEKDHKNDSSKCTTLAPFESRHLPGSLRLKPVLKFIPKKLSHRETPVLSVNATIEKVFKNLTLNDAKNVSETTTIRTEKEEVIGDANQFKRTEHENQQNIHIHRHLIAMHDKLDALEKYSKDVENHLFMMTCLISIGFGIIVMVAAWMMINRFSRNVDSAQVIYRRNDNAVNAVENSLYDVVQFNK